MVEMEEVHQATKERRKEKLVHTNLTSPQPLKCFHFYQSKQVVGKTTRKFSKKKEKKRKEKKRKEKKRKEKKQESFGKNIRKFAACEIWYDQMFAQKQIYQPSSFPQSQPFAPKVSR